MILTIEEYAGACILAGILLGIPIGYALALFVLTRSPRD